jgi:uncharacterized protein YdeI (YjbR/CyaY-like superfamily)
MKVKHFKNPEALRAWLEKHHATQRELWVGYYRKDCGRPSITWQELVEVALCYGWIDGIRQKVDEISYTNRFTPRRPGSIWSTINTKTARALIASGAMQPAGLAAFKLRKARRSGIYSFELPGTELSRKHEQMFRRNRTAWAFYQAQPPGYRKMVNGWVVRAKREATQLSRLEQVIAHSAKGERVPQFSRTKARK